MLTFYIILVAATLVLCVLSENLTKNRWIVLTVWALVLIVIAGFRAPGVSVDYPIYNGHFQRILPFFMLFESPKAFFAATGIEPAFIFFCSLFKSVFQPDVSYFVLSLLFATLAVSLKVKCINDYTPFVFYSLFLYVCYYFLLHELIQMRAGVAIGISLYSLRYIIRRDFGKFTLLLLLAITFHYSVIVLFPFYFVSTKKINPIGYLSLIVVSFILMKCNLDIFGILDRFDLGVYSDKIQIYKLDQSWQKYELNPINMVVMFQLAITVFLLFFSKDLAERNPYGILFLKMNVFSIVCLYMCASLPAFAFRMWELLHVSLIFLFPYLLYYLKPRWLAELVIAFVGICLFFNMLNHDHLLTYQFISL